MLSLVKTVRSPPEGEFAAAGANIAMGAAAALAKVLATLRNRADDAGNRLECSWQEASILRNGEQLVSELLAFAGQQHLVPEKVEVKAFLCAFAHLLRRSLDVRVEVVVTVESECPAWHVDRGALQEALTQLAHNSFSAMPQGGCLTFRASVDRRDGTRGTLLEIFDTGTGMSAAVLGVAATPFFTTKVDSPLSGMGLPAVAGFAAQSGGSMDISSTPGCGTRVALSLPTLEHGSAGTGMLRGDRLGSECTEDDAR